MEADVGNDQQFDPNHGVRQVQGIVGVAEQERERMAKAAEEVRRVLLGEPPRNLVNRPMLVEPRISIA